MHIVKKQNSNYREPRFTVDVSISFPPAVNRGFTHYCTTTRLLVGDVTLTLWLLKLATSTVIRFLRTRFQEFIKVVSIVMVFSKKICEVV